jgi:CubicO group peptidase (beta-lactamase class C family)
MRFAFYAAGLFVLATAAVSHAKDATPHSTARFVKARTELHSPGLAMHAPRRDTLTGPEVRRYTFAMRAGQFAAIKVRQTSGNVACAMFDPDGRLIDLADRAGEGFDETLTVTAAKAGVYSVQTAMFAWDSLPAGYEIELIRQEAAGHTPAAIADQLIASWYDSAHAGAAVGVVQDGKSIFQRTVGLADIGEGRAITVSTRFDLASVSKQFTAYAVAILADRGQIGLDDDVRRYLPELPQLGKTVTVRHLLNHTSGVRDWDVLFGLMGRAIEDGITKAEILDVAARQKALNFAPGTAQQYSNTGYNILAEIVARVVKEPFASFVQRNIFTANGMSAKANEEARASIAGTANSYGRRYPFAHLLSARSMAAAGSSSVQASLHDLTAWAIALERGAAGGPGVAKLTEQPGTLDDGVKTDYGFGQWFGDRRGVRTVGHLGLAAGYRISFRRFPERRLAVIYLANDGDDVAYSRAQIIENLFLGVPAEPVEVPEGEYEPVRTAPMTASEAAAFSGLYYSPELRTTYEIRGGAGGLIAYHALNGAIPLGRSKGDNFHTDRFFMPVVAFDRDTRNAVQGLRVSAEGARNIFFKKIAP